MPAALVLPRAPTAQNNVPGSVPYRRECDAARHLEGGQYVDVGADRVLQILDLLATAQVVVWVNGGWGVDALIGRQTREHEDLDLVVDAGRVDHVRALLHREGFEVIRDWSPTAIAFLHPDGRCVDVHLVELTPDGGGDQIQLDRQTRWHYGAPTSGHIGGRTVACCSLADQVASHLGYEPDAQDLADMQALAEAFGCPLPPPYA